jgi:uncharacterized protein
MEPRISTITLGVENLERAYKFYKEGLGFPTQREPEDGIIFFQLRGTALALYSYDALAEDSGKRIKAQPRTLFNGITLAHNVRTRAEVDAVLEQARRAGAKIETPAHATFWGGYAGYFSDPDGYLWEVACGLKID